MNRSKFKFLVVKAISFIIIAIFIYTATSKLLDFEQFRIQLGQSPLLSSFADFVSIGVILLEFGLSLLLSFPKTQSLGLLFSFGLMVMFSTYIYIILNFSDYIPCSCGGVIEKLSWNQHLIFNVLLILLSATGFLFSSFSIHPFKNKELCTFPKK